MDVYNAPTEFTYRICTNCHRLVSDRKDGAHEKPHPCFTPPYLAGYFIGLVPQHMEQVIKTSLEPLGIDADDAFVQGFRDGMEAAERFAVNRSTSSPKDVEQRVKSAWYDGRQDGEGDFVKRVEACHCGNVECQQFKAEHPAELVLQPCHCGAQGCLELCSIEQPVDDIRLLMHVPPASVNTRRRQFWWEDDEETR
jgi:hypothetical protein